MAFGLPDLTKLPQEIQDALNPVIKTLLDRMDEIEAKAAADTAALEAKVAGDVAATIALVKTDLIDPLTPQLAELTGSMKLIAAFVSGIKVGV